MSWVLNGYLHFQNNLSTLRSVPAGLCHDYMLSVGHPYFSAVHTCNLHVGLLYNHTITVRNNEHKGEHTQLY